MNTKAETLLTSQAEQCPPHDAEVLEELDDDKHLSALSGNPGNAQGQIGVALDILPRFGDSGLLLKLLR